MIESNVEEGKHYAKKGFIKKEERWKQMKRQEHSTKQSILSKMKKEGDGKKRKKMNLGRTQRKAYQSKST